MARERFDEARPVDAVTSRRLPPSSGRMRRGAVLGPAPPPPFRLSLSRPPFSLGDPPDPVQAPFCSSHMWGVSLYPTRMNQPVNARIFVPVPRPPPSPLAVSLPCLLVPYSWKIGSIQRFPPPWSGLLRALTGHFYSLLLRLPRENAASSARLWRSGRLSRISRKGQTTRLPGCPRGRPRRTNTILLATRRRLGARPWLMAPG